MSNEIPRRARVDLYVPAETAIREAMLAVEAMGADVLLTKAVVLLGRAKDAVADYVDREPITMFACPPPCSNGQHCRDEGGKHICAHDFNSGPWIETKHSGCGSCACGMTALDHDMRYAP